MKTNKHLQLAYDFVQYTGQNIFLTGKAGTGKTTFLKNLKEKSPKRMVVVAPTGVAAINAGGVTVHSFFQLSFAPFVGIDKEESRSKRFTKAKINIIRSLDLLVIDEISMVRADVLDAIDSVMRRFKNRQKPFGGAQVLMIGDLRQLSPVVKREEWELLKQEYETPYFFSSKTLKEFPYISIELTEVFRQQDEKFISLLNKVRDNQMNEEVIRELNKRYIPGFAPKEEEGYVTLCTHNATAQNINDSKLQSINGKKRTYKAVIEGDFPEYSIPTDFDLKLKIGAQVMFVKNDPDPEKRFYNGKIGKITELGEDTVTVKCPEEETEIETGPLVWENIKYSIHPETKEIQENLAGSFKQIPLKLAWAITIHKSQGLTLPKAIIDAEASFAHGQVYVALSRCQSLENMVLSSPINSGSVINDTRVVSYIHNVEENQPGENELQDARMAFQKELLIDMFSFDRIRYFVNTIHKINVENKGSFPEILSKLFQMIKEKFQADIALVGDKFRDQINQYLISEPDIEKNSPLIDRIKKAAAYFEDKINTHLVTPLEAADLEIDNKEIRKQINRLTKDLLEETIVKLAAYKVCQNGFSIKDIMEARAKAQLSDADAGQTRQKKQVVFNEEDIPHPELYGRLREYRMEKSNELGLPPYMIFSQKALFEMVTYLPTHLKTLQAVKGMGARKTDQYGEDIIGIISHYCHERHIDRGSIPMKEIPKKEKKPKIDTKKVSLEMFEANKSAAEIAEERGLTQSTIEGHLAHYVQTGQLEITRLLDEAALKKIADYFDKAGDKLLTPAKTHFGNEFSYGQLKLGLSYFERRRNVK